MASPPPDLWDIGLNYLPIEDMIRLADLLDPQNGEICMETFAQKVDILHEYRLRLDAQKLTAIRHRNGQGRPTIILFKEYLQPRGVTIGEIKYVLEEMGAATTNIFDITRIHGMYNADVSLPSGSSPSQHPCSCPECNIRVVDPRLDATQRVPGSPPRRNRDSNDRFERRNSHAAPGSRYIPGSIQRNWIPPSDCCCNERTCPQCEERRLSDPDETVVLSVSQNEQYAGARLNRLSQPTSRALSDRISYEHNIGDEELIHEVSYTENTVNFVDLRGSPEGTSNFEFPTSNERMYKNRLSQNKDARIKVQCTCRKSIAPDCTCKHIQRLPSRNSQQYSALSKNGDKSNRWSTESAPLTGQNTSEDMIYNRYDNELLGNSSCSQETMFSRQSNKSISDSDISYSSNNTPMDRQAGYRVLISYTDDVKDDVICLSESLIEDGFDVSTDMQEKSYYKAKNKGFVTENNQYDWLRKKYRQAKHIIVCLSKGYFECLNMNPDNAFPSTQYLNARYIFNMIKTEPRQNEHVVEVTFRDTLQNTSSPFQYPKRFDIPAQMRDLKFYMRN